MCQYAVNDHGVNLPPVLFKLSMSWILVDFLGRISATPPKSLPNECEEYFLLVVTEAVSIATWANGSRHDFFWTWILPFFLGGGVLVDDKMKPETLFFLAISVGTWSIDYRLFGGWSWNRHIYKSLPAWKHYFALLKDFTPCISSLNSNFPDFIVSILLPGYFCFFCCWRAMIKPTM